MIASHLYIEHDVTILDPCAKLPDKFLNLDITHIVSNGVDLTSLEQVKSVKAELFIACSDLDEANIIACWSVKKIISIDTVCFVGREEIYNTLMSPDQYNYQTSQDIDTVIWPEQLLTQDIFRIVMVPDAIDVEHFDGGQIKLFEYRIKAGCPLCGTRIMDYDFPANCLIVGITRDEVLFIPTGDTLVELEDRVIFMGSSKALDMLAANLFKVTHKVATAAIIGGGNVGYYLASQMEQTGIKVKVIEKDEQRCFLLADRLKSSLVLNGDGTDLEMLEEEGVGSVDVVVCVTNNDEKNLLCSLLVKQLGAERVVTRSSSTHKAALFERVGIDVVVSPKESALKELLNHLHARDIDILAMVGGGKGEVVRLKVADSFSDTQVKDIALPQDTIIATLRRGKGSIIPNGNTLVRSGDMLTIFTLPERTEEIQAVFAQ